MDDQATEYSKLLESGTRFFGSAQYEQSLESLNKATQVNPNDPTAWGLCGIILAQLDRYTEAVRSYDKALQYTQQNPDSMVTLLQARGHALVELGRYSESLVDYDKAIQLRPNDVTILSERGLVLGALTDDYEALETFDRAIQIQPNYAPAWGHRSVILHEMEQYEEAVQSCDKAIQLQLDDELAASTWLVRGMALVELGRNEESLISFNKAIAIDTDYEYTLSNLYGHDLILVLKEIGLLDGHGIEHADEGLVRKWDKEGRLSDQNVKPSTKQQPKPKEPELKTIENWEAKCPSCGGTVTLLIKSPYQYPYGQCTVCRKWVSFTETGQHKQTQQAESCYIVTMCFGIDSPEYTDMIYFRDNTLGRYGVGRAIIYSYYRIGGQLVKYLGYSSTARAVSTHIVRGILVIIRRWNRTGETI